MYPQSLPFERFPAFSFIDRSNLTNLGHMLSESCQNIPSVKSKSEKLVFKTIHNSESQQVKSFKETFPEYMQMNQKVHINFPPNTISISNSIKSYNENDSDGAKDSFYVAALYIVAGISGYETVVLEKQVRNVEHSLAAYSNALK